jgi:hypothetical protein
MPDELSTREDPLRRVLTELSMGRLTVDEAYAQIDDLSIRSPTPRKKSSPQSIGAGVLILLFGAVFGGVGLFFLSKALSFSHDSAHVEGTVVRHERSGDKGNRLPVVRYEVDGKSHELRGDIASNSPPAVNSKVSIIYKTADPGQAQIDSFVQRWLFPLVFGGIGGLVTLVGLAVLLRGIVSRFRPATSSSDRFTV